VTRASDTSSNRLPFLARLGRWCHDRRWWVLGLWIATLVGLGAVLGGTGSGYSTEFSLPDVESARGFDTIDEHFGGMGGGATGTIVFTTDAEGGVTDPSVQEPMTALFDEVAALPDVSRVTSPYGPAGARQIAEGGAIAYAEIEMPRDITIEEAGEVRDEILASIPDVDGLRVELGGQMFAEFEPPNS
jgi:RND superfamily putative drug exporter